MDPKDKTSAELQISRLTEARLACLAKTFGTTPGGIIDMVVNAASPILSTEKTLRRAEAVLALAELEEPS